MKLLRQKAGGEVFHCDHTGSVSTDMTSRTPESILQNCQDIFRSIQEMSCEDPLTTETLKAIVDRTHLHHDCVNDMLEMMEKDAVSGDVRSAFYSNLEDMTDVTTRVARLAKKNINGV